ncbi:hypothetical protein DFH08DRAFT_841706 [Mycena albidolilacea]|uniref:Uncharacterized protein n=1 Tax=Mycena albidolilacea TaxID=1033008 RepID=A0AAD7AMU1_9AGAR|nr:hypothetical protein DFH08DRAFT_841706 [Mycena albidolilacea]
MTTLLLVLRFTSLAFVNSQVSIKNALEQAYTRHSASNLGVKVGAWLAASPHTEEEIVGFINSIPWDMNIET